MNLNDLKFVVCNKPIDIYIDGSFYLYTGFIPVNLKNENVYDDYKVANTVFELIENSLMKIKEFNINIGTVRVYFDGKKPVCKYKTMTQRRKRNIKIQGLQNIRAHLCRMLNDANVELHNLIIGEAEHEMFIHRNASRPSIMLTDDSDLFHIAYGYDSRTVNDIAFMGVKSFNFTCNLEDLYGTFQNMPKIMFVVLCALKGSDFTCDTITTTMFKAVLFEFRNPSSERIKHILDKIYILGKKYKDIEIKVQYKVAKWKASLYNEIEFENDCNDSMYPDDYNDDDAGVSDYERIDDVYEIADVILCIKYMLYILKFTSYKFRWNSTSKCEANEPSLIIEEWYKDAIFNQMQVVHWTVNYSLIGSRYIKYFNEINQPSFMPTFAFYYAILSYKSGCLYKTLENLKLQKMKRFSFMKYFENEHVEC